MNPTILNFCDLTLWSFLEGLQIGKFGIMPEGSLLNIGHTKETLEETEAIVGFLDVPQEDGALLAHVTYYLLRCGYLSATANRKDIEHVSESLIGEFHARDIAKKHQLLHSGIVVAEHPVFGMLQAQVLHSDVVAIFITTTFSND